MHIMRTSTIGLTASKCEGLAHKEMCTDLPTLCVGRSCMTLLIHMVI